MRTAQLNLAASFASTSYMPGFVRFDAWERSREEVGAGSTRARSVAGSDEASDCNYQLHPFLISANAASAPEISKIAVTGLSLYGVTLTINLSDSIISFIALIGEPG